MTTSSTTPTPSGPVARAVTELFETESRHDRNLALQATGLLATFNTAGVITAGDVHVATTLGRLAQESDEHVLLAAALAARSVQHGSVCLDPRTVSAIAPDLPWPEPESWLGSVRESALVSQGALVVEAGLVYLPRYHQDEVAVHQDLVARMSRPAPGVDRELLQVSMDRMFPGPGYEEQHHAVAEAAQRWFSVLTGGPGTGKTTTVAGLLVALSDQWDHQRAGAHGSRAVRIALAAPTGKAAAQLQASVSDALKQRGDAEDLSRLGDLQATTLHRLLGWRPDSSSRFRHDRTNRLPHDIVVVDETSMVSLSMMARLLEAVRPDARLVLVGDPDQLTSVDAGAVLGDLVRGFGSGEHSPVERLTTTHRFGAGVGDLAAAVRNGQGDEAMAVLTSGHPGVEWVEADGPTQTLRGTLLGPARRMHDAAVEGDAATAMAALGDHRLLCAHREGPYGVRRWNQQVLTWLAEDLDEPLRSASYPGRPLMVTANDPSLGVHNGDIGVLVQSQRRLRAVIDGAVGSFDVDPNRLPDAETVYAMTIHKSQGSQAAEITVVLPDPDSRLLTRELLYTAITRAKERVRLVGSEESLRAAIDRRVQRASGLHLRLADPST